MTEGHEVRAAFRRKSAEIAVAALIFLLGAIVIFDSARLGFGWQEIHGPRPGYFPFYIGLIMCVASLVNVARALMVRGADNKTFVEVGQLKLVLSVLVPTMVYVLLVTWIGVYISSVLFIGFFMRWLGKYPWPKSASVGVIVSVSLFLMFEVWFKVPLFKGAYDPLAWLGF